MGNSFTQCLTPLSDLIDEFLPPFSDSPIELRLKTAEEHYHYLSNQNLSAYQEHRLDTAISALRNAVYKLKRIFRKLKDPELSVNRRFYMEIFYRNERIILDLMSRYQNQPPEDEMTPPTSPTTSPATSPTTSRATSSATSSTTSLSRLVKLSTEYL